MKDQFINEAMHVQRIVELERAISLVCEGWTLPHDARKVLETVLWSRAVLSKAATLETTNQRCPLGCSGPEQGGTGCVAVTGECALDSQLTARALHLIDVLIPFRLRLIDKGECVDASVQTIRDALPEVRAALSKVHEQQIQQPSCAREPVALSQPAITQAQLKDFCAYMDVLLQKGSPSVVKAAHTIMEWYQGIDVEEAQVALSQPAISEAAEPHPDTLILAAYRKLIHTHHTEPDGSEFGFGRVRFDDKGQLVAFYWAGHDEIDAAIDSLRVRDDSANSSDADSQQGVGSKVQPEKSK